MRKAASLQAGDFASVNGVVRTNLTRFNNDGTLDNSFIAAAGTDFPVNSVVLEKYGRILIGGYFNTVNGVANNYIARLNADGDFDPSFNTPVQAPVTWYIRWRLQSDDKVIIGGAFTDFNGTLLSGIARLQNVVMVSSPPRLFNPAFSNNVVQGIGCDSDRKELYAAI